MDQIQFLVQLHQQVEVMVLEAGLQHQQDQHNLEDQEDQVVEEEQI